MPIQKDFKRLVRRRMQKTGESYTTARAQLLRKNGASPEHVAVASRAAAPKVVKAPAATTRAKAPRTDYAALAGMSDAALKAATGCAWEKWVKSLDHLEAHTWPHRKIAAHVHETYAISGWWSQCVAVGYERIRGLRDIGQRRGGDYEASKSKTFAVPVRRLYEAFAVARTRGRWLRGVALTVRKATPDRSVRMTWPDGTSVEVWLTAKGDAKSNVSIQHRKLPDKATVTKTKAYWTERLQALGEVLGA